MKIKNLSILYLFLILSLLTACSKDKESHPIDKALVEGDSSLLSESHIPELQLRILNKIDGFEEQKTTVVKSVFSAASIDYQVGNRVALFNLTDYRNNFPLITGSEEGHIMAFAGEKENARYAAFNTGIITRFHAQETELEWLQNPFKRLLSWLFKHRTLDGSGLNENHRVALTHFKETNETNTINWLSEQFDQWEFTACNDGALLNECYQNMDLILVSWEGGSDDEAEDTATALSNALVAGIPVLYIHSDLEYTTPITEKVSEVLGATIPYGGNFWADDIAVWENPDVMLASQSTELDDVRKLFQHFVDDDFEFDWSACDDSCESDPLFVSEFRNGIKLLKDNLDLLENKHLDLFTETDFELEKMAVLLADKIRENITFPMDKLTSGNSDFLKSYYADHLVYYQRKHGKAQQNLGNFSRSDFSHITPAEYNVSLISHNGFHATGVYALPGETVTVTRNDSSDVDIAVFVNSVREGTTKAFAANGYNRPLYVQSRHFPVDSGDSISFVSPYGGPVQVSFDSKGLDVELTFKNVGKHPFWNDTGDDATFITELAANNYDWAEIVTPYFEVHSTREKMLNTMAKSYWLDSVSTLSTYVNKYLHDYPRALAGLRGDGITPIAEVDNFAAGKGWTIDENTVLKHMNADQPLCGYGCAGNPYDAGWYFMQDGTSPISHGDGHEVGHELEGSMLFDGWNFHSKTNYYVFYSKAKLYQETGEPHGCFDLPFQDLFTILQASTGQSDPAAYIKTNLWDVNQWDDGAGMMLQIMMAAQAQGTLLDGWNVRPILHIMEREFNRAKVDEASWLSKRDSLGFSSYSHSEAGSISNNDWLTIALSYVTQRDMRDYFTMWAIPYTEKADSQVASFSYPSMPRTFFASGNNAFCETLDHTPISIDGVSSWPGS